MKKKKLITTCTIIILAISFSFCKDIKLKKTTEELLNAKWKIVDVEYKIINNGKNTSLYKYMGSPTDYMAFTNDSKVYRLMHGTKDIITYTLISGNTILYDNDTMLIKTLTTEVCTLKLKSGTKNNYHEQVINLRK